jgi:hypothetical protein
MTRIGKEREHAEYRHTCEDRTYIAVSGDPVQDHAFAQERQQVREVVDELCKEQSTIEIPSILHLRLAV